MFTFFLILVKKVICVDGLKCMWFFLQKTGHKDEQNFKVVDAVKKKEIENILKI